jgi:hypothetical protein
MYCSHGHEPWHDIPHLVSFRQIIKSSVWAYKFIAGNILILKIKQPFWYKNVYTREKWNTIYIIIIIIIIIIICSLFNDAVSNWDYRASNVGITVNNEL